ncbi:MAG: glutaminyl-peptide cyclotransferase [Gammaproteobacteria bacterium]
MWQTNRIVIIDPNNGNVTGWLNLDGIQEYLDYTTSIDVLNGRRQNINAGITRIRYCMTPPDVFLLLLVN